MSVLRRSVTSFSLWSARNQHCSVYSIVFAVYKYYICIVHLTFWGFIESQDYFTLLSHGKQVDGTEEEILNRENSVTFSQAVRMGL